MKRRTPSSVSVDRPPSTDVVFSVLLVLVAFGMLYLYNLGGWLINDDEGSFLYQVWRISQGQRPYQDLFSSRWPLFLYTGGWWMRVFGATAVPMRVLSVGLTLGTAVLVFSMARQILPTRAALLSLIVFLVHPDVFLFGRSFQPEPFYLFFSMLGMFLVTRGRAKGSVPSFLGAGVVFAVASLYKLLTVWVLMGCMLFLGVTWWRNRGHRRQVVFWALALLLPFGVVFGLVVGGFTLGVPRFYDSVVGVNLAQGQELSPLDVVFKGIAALVVHFFTTPLLLLALPAAWRGWRGDQKVALFGWQLPTVLIFLFLSRDIFPRLLLYLVPSLSILFVATVEPIRRLSRRSLLLLAVVGSLVVPWLMSDFLVLMRSEQATMSVVRHIQAWTPPDAYVLSDYQELNFHARRLSTYLGAELSHVILAGGTVRGTDLIAEIESSDVRMVIVDVSPLGQHIVHLPDYGAFRAYLEQHFTLLDVLPREGQLLEVYYREP